MSGERTLTIPARQARTYLLMIAVALTLISLGARLLEGGTAGLATFVNVNAERSYPNWYSSLGLAASSLFLGATAWAMHSSNQKKFLSHWIFLSVTFALLSSDEIVTIHEGIGSFINHFFHFRGYLRFAWVIPAGIGLCVFGLSYLRFLADLTPRRRTQFMLAGATYVLGAVGIEMIGGKIADLHTKSSTAYALCYHVEEFLELCGIALFNAALIEHLATLLGPEGLRLRFSDE